MPDPDSEIESPKIPDLEVDWIPPAVIGVIYGPDGEPLVVIHEQRPPFGFGRR